MKGEENIHCIRLIFRYKNIKYLQEYQSYGNIVIFLSFYLRKFFIYVVYIKHSNSYQIIVTQDESICITIYLDLFRQLSDKIVSIGVELVVCVRDLQISYQRLYYYYTQQRVLLIQKSVFSKLFRVSQKIAKFVLFLLFTTFLDAYLTNILSMLSILFHEKCILLVVRFDYEKRCWVVICGKVQILSPRVTFQIAKERRVFN
eukprot:TRINITY_DN2246_c0_g1_i5.p1 TRINITY_DN2246_c0_g1~~TRINITY_DN2246_c0_g1_i5.p1  ORF type:complete len:202 (+),score=-12.08 TRINITY_DN2246_c0_g1_i5:87-692(+)